MMLGPCRGGAVRLAAPGDALMVGEGIETCFAAMLATGKPTWGALSTSGLRTGIGAAFGKNARNSNAATHKQVAAPRLGNSAEEHLVEAAP
jgi:hypothetical protein